MTRTYATLEVPGVVFAAVKALLQRADGRTIDGPEIDMHGIAMVARKGSKTEGEFSVGTILSARDGAGKVEIALGGELMQVDVAKAKVIVGMLHEAIEAAITDEMVSKFLIGEFRLSQEQAAIAVGRMREYRQGSRDVVNPS